MTPLSPLERLCYRAGFTLGRYAMAQWFAGCELRKTVLFVPSAEVQETLDRLYGPDLRRVLPDLTFALHTPAKPARYASLKASAPAQGELL